MFKTEDLRDPYAEFTVEALLVESHRLPEEVRTHGAALLAARNPKNTDVSIQWTTRAAITRATATLYEEEAVPHGITAEVEGDHPDAVYMPMERFSVATQRALALLHHFSDAA